MTQRSFGATTFEEEKQGLLDAAAELAELSQGRGGVAPPSVLHRLQQAYANSSEELRADREAAIAVVHLSGTQLRHCSEALRDDLAVVSAALTSQGFGSRAFEYISEERKSDPKLIGLALGTIEGLFANRLVDEFLSSAMIPDVCKTDQDKALAVYRETPDDQCARTWYSKLDSKIKSEIPCECFELASRSALAVAGEEGAPVLTVMTLCHRPDEEAGSGHSFHCQATLLSGTTITCQIPDQRPSPTLNDLAMKLVNEIRDSSQGEAAPQHIFITFPREDGDHVEVSVWDFDRSLSDFFFADESYSEFKTNAAASP